MGDIKSAREIAMEKIDKIGEPSEEERLEWKYIPEGEKLAARYPYGTLESGAKSKYNGGWGEIRRRDGTVIKQ